MGQLIIHDVVNPWGHNNWWRSYYDLESYHKIYFMVSDEFEAKNPGYKLDPMEWKKWVTTELQGEVIVREDGRGSGWVTITMYILLDEDYFKFKMSKWYDILHKVS